MRIALLAVLALTASACAPMSEAPATGGDLPGRSVDATSCTARGGTIQRVGRMQSEQCVIAYADAGKQCTDGDQCEGDCRIEDAPFPAEGAAARGQCQADSRPFGCHATVESGKATPALCVD
ncbi:MAG TPA: hypothetical protein VGB60_09875 [Brevundimonas sp.]|uniref:hypothetical protein n=1 Tax=Brevundimonas sp. TaxID=1871086 RepID=UPI002ED98BA5